jgi:hypothetical protein
MTNLEITNLERVYKFTDETFRDYMYLGDADAVPWNHLLELSARMADHDHPLVRSAAGWAAAEIAIKRSGPTESVPIAVREAALSLADTIWKPLPRAFDELQSRTDGEKAREKLFSARLRLQMAQACLPSFNLVAHMLSDSPVSLKQEHRLVGKTKRQLFALGRRVMLDWRYAMTVAGVRNEIMGALLLQDDPRERVIVVPTPLRVDHSQRPSMRSDLITVATSQPHTRTRIQISTDKVRHPLEPNRRRSRLVINVADNFLLTPDSKPAHTWTALVANQNRIADKQTYKRLKGMSRQLVDMIMDFRSDPRPTLCSETGMQSDAPSAAGVTEIADTNEQ